MSEVGIRELKQNASAVVARAVEGETVTITDRGRPVALLTGIEKSPLERLIDEGNVELPAEGTPPIWDLPRLPPAPEGQPTLTQILLEMRQEERW